MVNLPDGEQKEKYVRELFESIAGKYDLMNSVMTFGMDRRWRRFMVKRSGINPRGAALDICCGTGKNTMELARVVGSGGYVTGLDFSPKMLSVARRVAAESNIGQAITYVEGDAMCLPFLDNSFDAVTVGWGLRNVPDISYVIQEMQRVVKPGGIIVSLDMGKPELPIFKQIYWIFCKRMVPFMGKVWTEKKWAYDYLFHSAKAFLPPKELALLFSKTGLVNVTYHNLFGGVVAVVEGHKPDSK